MLTALKQTLSPRDPKVSLQKLAFGVMITLVFFPFLVHNDFPKESGNLLSTTCFPLSYMKKVLCFLIPFI